MLANRFTHYTLMEGGGWFEFNPPATISNQYLRTTPPIDDKIKMPDRNLLIHALKCEDGRIWDCVNGWRP